MTEQSIGWVCNSCGQKALTYKQNKGKKKLAMSTWHMDTCSVCGAYAPVTENRDFGHPTYPKEMLRKREPVQTTIFDFIKPNGKENINVSSSNY